MGIPVDAVDFFAELELNNERAWWTANQERWRRSVREPMEKLCDGLTDEFGEAKLFRPYRDVRFSSDKTPYKTHQGAVVATSPGVGLYVQVSSQGLLAGAGWWGGEPGQPGAHRGAGAGGGRGEALASIVTVLEEDGAEVHGEELKTAPRGVDPGHPRIRLLRYRTLLVTVEHGVPDWLGTPEALETVRADWRACRPLIGWLDAHLAG